MRHFTRYSRAVSGNGLGLPMHRSDNAIGIREETGLHVRSAGKQFYDPDDGSLMGAWLMDEGTGLFVRDHSIYENHGLTVNDPTWVPDGVDLETDLDQRIYLGISDIFRGGFNPTFTLFFWFKPEVINITQILFHTGDLSSNGTGIYLTNAGKTVFYGTSGELTGDIIHIADVWSLIAVTTDGTSRKININGVPDKQDTLGANTLDLDYGTWIGSRSTLTTADGIMNSFFIYNKVFSDLELADIYAAGMYRRTETMKVTNV